MRPNTETERVAGHMLCSSTCECVGGGRYMCNNTQEYGKHPLGHVQNRRDRNSLAKYWRALPARASRGGWQKHHWEFGHSSHEASVHLLRRLARHIFVVDQPHFPTVLDSQITRMTAFSNLDNREWDRFRVLQAHWSLCNTHVLQLSRARFKSHQHPLFHGRFLNLFKNRCPRAMFNFLYRACTTSFLATTHVRVPKLTDPTHVTWRSTSSRLKKAPEEP
mmetsp:Transcript_7536/g.20616  ORF Transcript_7536/g.20616 Transcript_7536/m.20616 type:complete len:220 (+) Transcript_7536:163-822(+)